MVICESLETRLLLSGTSPAPLAKIGRVQPAAALIRHASPQLSVARGDLSAVAVGNDVLFAGGYTDEVNATSVVDIYNARKGTWTTAALSQPRGDIAAASAGGDAFFASGNTESAQSTGVLDIYNSSTGAWTSVDQVPHGDEYSPEAIGVGNQVLLMLGKPTMEIYDVPSGQMSKQSFPRGTFPSYLMGNQGPSPTVASVGNDTYVMLTDSNHDTILGVYDTDAGTWSKIACPSFTTAGPATSVGPLVLFPVTARRSELLVLNTLTRHLSFMRMGRAGNLQAVTSVGDKAIFSGGDQGSTAYIFDTSTGTLTKQRLGGIEFYDAAASIGREAIFAGGAYPFEASPSDAVAIVTDPTPVPVLSGNVGSNVGGRSATVTIDNTGDAGLAAGVPVKLYATTGGDLASAVAKLGEVSLPAALKPGGSMRLKVPMRVSKDLPPGNYIVLAAAASAGHMDAFAAQPTFEVHGAPSVRSVRSLRSSTRSDMPARAAIEYAPTRLAADSLISAMPVQCSTFLIDDDNLLK